MKGMVNFKRFIPVGESFVVKVSLNSEEIINYEMQVANRGDWPVRSLVYLCREFDQLQHGEDYRDIRPVTHIGFLDFPLFPEKPEFYATYRIQNGRNHHLYTDKFTLSVVNLNQIELATEKRVKEITKLEKTSPSDFTLCEQSFFTPEERKRSSGGMKL